MRELARWMMECFGVSARRACEVVRLPRSTWLYQSRRVEPVALKQRIRDLARTRTRYGYLRIHAVLRREGWAVNRKRVYRLYREMGLQMRRKPPKRRVQAKLREARVPARFRNDCWSMDFMADQTFDGRRLRVLTVVDHIWSAPFCKRDSALTRIGLQSYIRLLVRIYLSSGPDGIRAGGSSSLHRLHFVESDPLPGFTPAGVAFFAIPSCHASQPRK